MTKLRLVPYRDLKKVLAAKGFHWLRCEGSHNVFRQESGRIVVVPDHGSQVIREAALTQNFKRLESES